MLSFWAGVAGTLQRIAGESLCNTNSICICSIGGVVVVVVVLVIVVVVVVTVVYWWWFWFGRSGLVR